MADLARFGISIDARLLEQFDQLIDAMAKDTVIAPKPYAI